MESDDLIVSSLQEMDWVQVMDSKPTFIYDLWAHLVGIAKNELGNSQTIQIHQDTIYQKQSSITFLRETHIVQKIRWKEARGSYVMKDVLW